MKKYPRIKIKDGQKYFFRFNLDERIQHIILAVSVIVLVLTGMPLKFSQTSWAPYLYSMFGGTKAAPIIHKVFGVILLLLFAYHVVRLVMVINQNSIQPLRKEGKMSVGNVLKTLAKQPLVPNLKDAHDIRDLFRYLLYMTNEHPAGDRFTWKEKFDYWAPFWGIFIIGLTGLIMWNKELSSHLVSGEVINICLIAHSDEALLAALFLFIWHWYNVHFSTSVFPLGTVFITGYLSEELMIEEHYDHYVKVMKEAGLEHEIKPPHGAHESHVEEQRMTPPPSRKAAKIEAEGEA